MATSNGILLKKIDPINYFDQFIAEGVYPDGRDTAQFRPFSVELSVDPRTYGSSYVQQDGACVSCTVQLSIAPDSDEPPILYELNSLDCIPKKLVEEANFHLERILSKQYLLDPNTLKILTKKPTTTGLDSQTSFELRYTLHLNISAISVDGFLTNAVLTAVQSAIMNVELPTVEYDGPSILEDEENFDISLEFDITKVKISRKNNSGGFKQLKLKDFLVYTPFLLYNSPNSTEQSSTMVLCDANSELCNLINNRYEVIQGRNEQFYELTYSSTNSLSETTFKEIILLSTRRHEAIWNAMKKSLPSPIIDQISN